MIETILAGVLAFGSDARAYQPTRARAPEGVVMWYEQPAAMWSEALPIGNGRLGAMVFGRADELLTVNEESVWSGAPQDRERDVTPDDLAETRRLAFDGQSLASQRLVEDRFMSEPIERGHHALGALRFVRAGEGDVTNYRRSLDLTTGIARTDFVLNGALHRQIAFASAIDDVVVLLLTADQPGAIDLRLSLDHAEPADREGLIDRQRTVGAGGVTGTMSITGRAVDGAGAGVRFVTAAHVEAMGGRIARGIDDADPSLVVHDADAVAVVIAAATTYVWPTPAADHGDPVARTTRTLARATEHGVDALIGRHVEDHEALFDRVALDLGWSPQAGKPTDVRLDAVGQGEVDPGLSALLFQYGRYLLMGSSRPGTMPATGHDLWSEHLEASRNAGDPLDGTLQMNYWPAEVTDLGECNEPLFNAIENLARRGRQTARSLYDARGWVAHQTTDAWWATVPVGPTAAGMWPCGGAWCTRHLWDRYAFDGDVGFLRQRAWPLLCGAAEFFVEYLADDPVTTQLVSGPSASSESVFITADGARVDVGMGNVADQQIVWDLFTNVLDAAEVLGETDDPFVERVRFARERLATPVIGPDGRLQEWARPHPEADPGTPHMIHFFGVHPGRQFSESRTPEVIAAIEKTLAERTAHDGARTGSRAWRINTSARLRDGDAAGAHLAAHLSDATQPNLLSAGSITDNLGVTSGIAEMLLQSHDGVIDILPALPPDWPNGSVRGLRARGGYTVDIAWRRGELSRAVIRADRDGTARVRVGDQVMEHGMSTEVPLRVGR